MTESSSALRKKITAERPIPASVEEQKPLWDAAIEEFEANLRSEWEQDDLTVTFEQRMTHLSGVVEAWPDDSIIIAVTIGDTDGYALFSPETAIILSDLYLKIAHEPNETDAPMASIDEILVARFVSSLTSCLAAQFNIGDSLEVADERLVKWPLSALRDTAKRLALDVEVALENASTVSMSLFLAADLPAFHAVPTSEATPLPAMMRATMDAKLSLCANLDQRRLCANDISLLQVGEIIRLPGASFGSINVAVFTPAGHIPIAKGEHGRSGGMQAIQIGKVDLAP